MIKSTRIGSLTETLAAIKMAKDAGYTGVVPRQVKPERNYRRSRGRDCGWPIKTGSISRSDRVAKYNQLIRIEEALGSRAPFNGLKEVKGQ
ncbi:hypothetical protein AB6846_10040 [Serratia proteamaculans]